ncbi:MAG: TlpA family protein disulfide reductase [Ilumatobacteraceae bacterium]
MNRSTRLRLFALAMGIVMVGLVAVGAPEVRDAIVDDDVDAVLTNPGEYQLSEAGEVITRAFFPSVDIVDVDGSTVNSSDLIGKPMVVNLWFAACPPCRREMPDFAAVNDRFGDDVVFVGINPVDSSEAMTDFAAQMGVTYDLYRDPLAELTDALGTVGFPYTVFVNAQGQILGDAGVLTADELTAAIGTYFGLVEGADI